MGNSFFGKLFRFLGFIAVGVAALYAGLNLLANSSLDLGFINSLNDTVTNLVSPTIVLYIFFGGFLLLIWTLGKTIFGKIIVSIVTLAVLLLELDNASISLLGLTADFTLFDLGFLDVLTSNDYITLGIFLGFVIFMWIVTFARKPKRSSVSILRFAMFMMVLVVVLQFLPTIMSVDFFQEDLYLGYIYPIYHALTLVFVLLSGALGVLTVFAK